MKQNNYSLYLQFLPKWSPLHSQVIPPKSLHLASLKQKLDESCSQSFPK